jgi:hypothetical protein
LQIPLQLALRIRTDHFEQPATQTSQRRPIDAE